MHTGYANKLRTRAYYYSSYYYRRRVEVMRIFSSVCMVETFPHNNCIRLQNNPRINTPLVRPSYSLRDFHLSVGTMYVRPDFTPSLSTLGTVYFSRAPCTTTVLRALIELLTAWRATGEILFSLSCPFLRRRAHRNRWMPWCAS